MKEQASDLSDLPLDVFISELQTHSLISVLPYVGSLCLQDSVFSMLYATECFWFCQ